MEDKKPKRSRGRPKLTDPAAVRLNVRVTEAQRALYQYAAWKEGVTLTAWIKAILDRESSLP